MSRRRGGTRSHYVHVPDQNKRMRYTRTALCKRASSYYVLVIALLLNAKIEKNKIRQPIVIAWAPAHRKTNSRVRKRITGAQIDPR